jgi:hypothetical protein
MNKFPRDRTFGSPLTVNPNVYRPPAGRSAQGYEVG